MLLYSLMKTFEQSITVKPNHYIQRTNHTSFFLSKVYGEVLHGLKNVADFGAGNSLFLPHLQASGMVENITRIDSDYINLAPPQPGVGSVISGDARYCPQIPNESHDATISSFLLQHLSSEDQYAVLKEMLRVTKSSECDTSGIVMIYPIYRTNVAKSYISQLPSELLQIVDYGYNSNNLDHFEDVWYPTLILNKKININPRVYDELILGIANSNMLSKRMPNVRRRLGNLATILYGTNLRDTPAGRL